MATTAEKTDPDLWSKVKQRVTKAGKGGKPGQWSARKAQMTVQAYKEEGGGFKGSKRPDNHLSQWTEEEWGTRSGQNSGETGERYLPKQARQNLSAADYGKTTRKKQRDTAAGRQFSAQPPAIAAATARYRHHADGATPGTKTALYAEARRRDIKGRSAMSKAELSAALA